MVRSHRMASRRSRLLSLPWRVVQCGCAHRRAGFIQYSVVNEHAEIKRRDLADLARSAQSPGSNRLLADSKSILRKPWFLLWRGVPNIENKKHVFARRVLFPDYLR